MIWDLFRDDIPPQKLIGHTDFVADICMIAEDRIISVSEDETLRLWDMVSGKEIARFYSDAPLTCISAISNHKIMAGDNMGKLLLLEIKNIPES